MNLIALKVALVKAGMTARELAFRIGMPETTLSYKMRGETEFKNSEIRAITKALELDLDQVNNIFFDGSVN